MTTSDLSVMESFGGDIKSQTKRGWVTFLFLFFYGVYTIIRNTISF